jgi:Putative Flp pilus-assembly TadE/G-like
MKLKVKETLQNERGNIALFVIGILAVMMILFVFVLNLSKVFAVKEQADSTTQQASIAATAVMYEELEGVIAEYETWLIGKLDSYPETIGEKVDEKIIDLNSDPDYNDYSANEISIEALDMVLIEELEHGFGKKELAEKLEDEIEHDIVKKMKNKARQTIVENGGNLEGATLEIENGQVYVKASNTVEGTSYKGFFDNFSDELFQQSGGPKMDFLEHIPFFDVGVESLES